MSIKVSLNSLSPESQQKISNELQFSPKETEYGSSGTRVEPYEIVGSSIYLPMAYSLKKLALRRPNRESYPAETVLPFVAKLRPLQREVKKEVLGVLGKTGSCIIALYPGAGKTFLSLHLANEIGFKTLIIVH